MRVGSLVFATDQGLGILAKSFYDHGIVTDIMVVRHSSRPTHNEWYSKGGEDAPMCLGLKSAGLFASRMDVMLFFETPFHWELLSYCRNHGIKTVLMPMYECEPEILPYHPDMFLCSSQLDLKIYKNKRKCATVECPKCKMIWTWNNLSNYFQSCPECMIQLPSNILFLPVPVEVPWRQRTKAEIFVHNAGHGGLKGRNGTKELLEALQYVKSPITFLLRTQDNRPGPIDIPDHITVVWRNGTAKYEDLYKDGDVFIFPEKFNGLSLPLQEARASGMLVMGTNRFPMNTWLPTITVDPSSGQLREPLIPVQDYRKNRVSPRCLEFDEAIVSPMDIARKIDEWYGADISEYSLQGKRWAEANSWEVLGPKYKKVLEDLVRG